MATHLRFDGVSGTVQTKSPEGMFTEELLQLNQPALVQYRLTTLKTVKLYLSEIEEQELLVQKIGRLFQQGKISQAQFDSEMVSIRSELESLRSDVQIYTGELPMPPLRKQRFGVALFTK